MLSTATIFTRTTKNARRLLSRLRAARHHVGGGGDEEEDRPWCFIIVKRLEYGFLFLCAPSRCHFEMFHRENFITITFVTILRLLYGNANSLGLSLGCTVTVDVVVVDIRGGLRNRVPPSVGKGWQGRTQCGNEKELYDIHPCR